MRASFGLVAGFAALHDVLSNPPNVLNNAFTADFVKLANPYTRTTEVRFSPCSDHMFFVDKAGNLVAESTVAGDLTFIYNIRDMVFDFTDHGATGLLLHPNFPATPSIFIFYTADPTNKWQDVCPLAVDADGLNYCDVVERLERFDLAVTVTGGRCTAFAVAKRQILMQDWCTTSTTHANGNIEWYDGADMILSSGDGAQAGVMDHGQRVGDVCYDPIKRYPQGRFRSQRMDFLHGKVFLIKATSLLKNAALVRTTDYSIVAQGLRQPYATTVNPWTLDVVIGDVGSTQYEEVNVITRSEMLNPALWPLNFGWPCLEGSVKPKDGYDDSVWLKGAGCSAAAGDLCNICDALWPCVDGVGSNGCSSSYRQPLFKFRESIDRNDALLCNSGTHAIVGLTWIVGSDFGAGAAAAIPYALVGSDYGSGCVFYWDIDPTTKRVLFEDGASVLATGHYNGLFLTRGKGGYLYSARGSSTDEFNYLWRWGLKGTNVGAGAPTAVLETSLLNPATGLYSSINCRGGCPITAGSTINFSGSSSTVAPGGAPIATYRIDYGDGTAPAVKATPVFTKKYNAAGVFKPVLTVTDTKGLFDQDTVTINVRAGAVAIVMTPASGMWKLGNIINYQITGVVAADVKSTAWDVTVSHCRPNQCTGTIDCHVHTGGVNPGGNALAGTLTPPGHAMPSSMVLSAVITPVTGSPFTVTAETTALQYTATVQAVANGVLQRGWPIQVVDVNTCYSPCTVPYMAGISTDLVAVQYMYRKFVVYSFVAWTSSSGVTSATGNIPITANGITVTATYAPLTVGVNAAYAPVILGATGYYGFVEIKWAVPPAGFDVVLISIYAAADGTNRDRAVVATDRRAVVGVPTVAKTYTVSLAGYDSASKVRTRFGYPLNVVSSGNPAETCYFQSSPYGGTAAVIPGTIQLERFDQGGDGTAYHDLTKGNTGGSTFSGDVDIEVIGASQYAITQADAGEWLQYTVKAATTKLYNFTFYLASTTTGTKIIYVMIDGTICDQKRAFVVYTQTGSTGGAFVAYPANSVRIEAGEHTLTLCIGTSGLHLDKMVIA